MFEELDAAAKEEIIGKSKIVIEEDDDSSEEDVPVKITKKAEEIPAPTLKKTASVVELVNEDMEKKERQQPAFKKILDKINTKKDAASKLFRTGDYSGAIKLY